MLRLYEYKERTNANMSYEEFLKFLDQKNVEILLEYQNVSYWLIKGKSIWFSEAKGATHLSFSSIDEFLSAPIINNQRMIDLWIGIKLLSIDGGWKKTIYLRRNSFDPVMLILDYMRKRRK
jgi:hypothetical protein